jgi:hypothetical protein
MQPTQAAKAVGGIIEMGDDECQLGRECRLPIAKCRIEMQRQKISTCLESLHSAFGIRQSAFSSHSAFRPLCRYNRFVGYRDCFKESV